ncbi:MAG: class I SAM-dependent methyltransferase [Dehalococcoidia bacterium]
MPKHYYTPVPDYTWLRHNPAAWMGRAPMTGVHWDTGEQARWLAEICGPYVGEVAGLHLYDTVTRSRVGPGYGPIESQVLHCFIRSACPRRVVEIGSGASTAFMLAAAARNAGEGRQETAFTCIEPYPKPAFRHLKNITHIKQPCQQVPEAVFAQLQAGDLLFVDSSHAVKIGSDVLRIYLDVIPKLPPGVYIHIHDIYLPYLYSRHALSNYFGWEETALVLALLTNNSRCAVRCCLSALHYDAAEELKHLLPDYRPQRNREGLDASTSEGDHFPSSLWLQTT